MADLWIALIALVLGLLLAPFAAAYGRAFERPRHLRQMQNHASHLQSQVVLNIATGLQIRGRLTSEAVAKFAEFSRQYPTTEALAPLRSSLRLWQELPRGVLDEVNNIQARKWAGAITYKQFESSLFEAHNEYVAHFPVEFLMLWFDAKHRLHVTNQEIARTVGIMDLTFQTTGLNYERVQQNLSAAFDAVEHQHFQLLAALQALMNYRLS